MSRRSHVRAGAAPLRGLESVGRIRLDRHVRPVAGEGRGQLDDLHPSGACSWRWCGRAGRRHRPLDASIAGWCVARPPGVERRTDPSGLGRRACGVGGLVSKGGRIRPGSHTREIAARQRWEFQLPTSDARRPPRPCRPRRRHRAAGSSRQSARASAPDPGRHGAGSRLAEASAQRRRSGLAVVVRVRASRPVRRWPLRPACARSDLLPRPDGRRRGARSFAGPPGQPARSRTGGQGRRANRRADRDATRR